jgi:hypothetical protein
MPLVRFTARCYINDTIYNEGDEALISDNTPLNMHMVNVATGETGGDPPGIPGGVHQPVFLDHLAHNPMGAALAAAAAAATPATPTLDTPPEPAPAKEA